MMNIIYAVAVLGILGGVFGAVLAFAAKIFYVEQDERIDQIVAVLPGANCGGCGYAGCGAYAEAVLSGEAEIGECASGGNECAQAMAAIMGIPVEAKKRKVAQVRCSGYRRVDESGKELGAKKKGEYEGFQDCLSATKVGGNGPIACKYGCLGFGSCVKACKYDAIRVVDGCAVVDREKCIGCKACAKACPRSIITFVEYDKNVCIPCNSHAKGAVTVRGCSQGCIGCSLCVKICPEQAITVDKNLATIDYSKCQNCGLCATVCPKKLIVVQDEVPAEVK